MKCDILIAGVGGQGTVLASKLLAASAISQGCFVRTSETIGMAQRGGCVVSHVRIGGEKEGSVIPVGKADIIIGFEPTEAARNLYRLSQNGICIVNTREIKPVTASLGAAKYDIKEINEYIKNNAGKAVFVDGYDIAEKAGSVKALNIALLGVALGEGILPFSKEVVEEIIR